jgi:hypothetical protein
MSQNPDVSHKLPRIREDLHLTGPELEQRFSALADSPSDSGEITLLLSRPGSGQRNIPDRVLLTRQSGMPGDRWAQLPVNDKTANMQLSVMETAVAELIANGQDLSLFGDNLVINLDISEQNLPIGSVLQAGEARLEVTPEPHTGCAQYQHRFGSAALRYISDQQRRAQRLRGVYMKVVQDGVVCLGDKITVV